ncbi:sec-independent protein translocase protein TatC [Limimonas halophila]|uniref:Sec-independent protein translocase protein TatC n=1 Tax=Limimonas halophila TaxID=1082479 RepID=A0A1G7NIZ0_9PROT|nr:twin-arginine translocase subunit TatC [Limimonas halophila]SDF73259.1 sec-independent protein translocase protein TatC [Limimonas halophila]
MADDTYDQKQMPLLDHLIELRQRLLYSVVALFVAFFVAFYFSQELYRFLTAPLADILLQKGMMGEDQRRMIFTDLTEVFFTYVKVAFFFAAFVTCPVFLTQLWLFMAPGLYRNERRVMAPFLIASPALFLLGASLAYFGVFPLAWEFFLSFEVQSASSGNLPIELEAKVNEYLGLVMKLIFAFGLCFQLPVLMTLMARTGMATSKGMAEKRKYAIVGVFIAAAIFTPPDPLSQIALALPIIALYEVSVWTAHLVEKRRAQEEAQMRAEATDDDEGEG